MLHIISQIHELAVILLKSSARISSNVATKKSALASVNTIGGLIFSTLWNGPSVLSRMPRSLMRLAIYEAWAAAGLCVSRSRTSSTPTKRPRPRTSPIKGCFSINWRKPFIKEVPTCSALACKRSSASTSRTARPMAHETGLPPKVLKYSMPLSNEAAISGVLTTAARGCPLPMDLPIVTISGTTPCLSKIVLRQHDLAAAAQQRLADERRHIVPSLLDMLDGVRNRAGIALARLGVGNLVLPAIHIRHGNLVDVGRRACATRTIELVRADLDQGRGVAVVGGVDHDGIFLPRMRTRQAQRQFVGFAAGADKVTDP